VNYPRGPTSVRSQPLFIRSCGFLEAAEFGWLGRGWEEAGKRLGRGWEEAGKRLGRGWEEAGKRLGRGWEEARK
jgi:hypothetical protein